MPKTSAQSMAALWGLLFDPPKVELTPFVLVSALRRVSQDGASGDERSQSLSRCAAPMVARRPAFDIEK